MPGSLDFKRDEGGSGSWENFIFKIALQEFSPGATQSTASLYKPWIHLIDAREINTRKRWGKGVWKL